MLPAALSISGRRAVLNSRSLDVKGRASAADSLRAKPKKVKSRACATCNVLRANRQRSGIGSKLVEWPPMAPISQRRRVETRTWPKTRRGRVPSAPRRCPRLADWLHGSTLADWLLFARDASNTMLPTLPFQLIPLGKAPLRWRP